MRWLGNTDLPRLIFPSLVDPCLGFSFCFNTYQGLPDRKLVMDLHVRSLGFLHALSRKPFAVCVDKKKQIFLTELGLITA